MKTSTANLTEAPKMYETENDNSQNLRSELENDDTADLFTEISCGVYQSLWFAESHSRAQK